MIASSTNKCGVTAGSHWVPTKGGGRRARERRFAELQPQLNGIGQQSPGFYYRP